jgi:peroxiredoxin
MAKVGEIAPDFTLENHEGKKVSLESLKGKPTVLFFYPKDVCNKKGKLSHTSIHSHIHAPISPKFCRHHTDASS